MSASTSVCILQEDIPQLLSALLLAVDHKLIMGPKVAPLPKTASPSNVVVKQTTKPSENFVVSKFIDYDATFLLHALKGGVNAAMQYSNLSVEREQWALHTIAFLIQSKATSPRQWAKFLAYCKSLPHARRHFNEVHSLLFSEKANLPAVQSWAGGFENITSWKTEFNHECLMDCATLTFPLPAAQYMFCGDLAYDLDILISLSWQSIDLVEKMGKNINFGCVKFDIGSETFETVPFKYTNGQLHCRLLECGLPCNVFTFSIAKIHVCLPISPVMSQNRLPFQMQHRCTVASFRNKKEKETFERCTIVFNPQKGDESPWIFSNGLVGKLITNDGGGEKIRKVIDSQDDDNDSE